MKTNNPWGVTFAAAAGMGTPDALTFVTDKLSSVVELFVRLGQLGVAIMTILYIYRKWKSAADKKKP